MDCKKKENIFKKDKNQNKSKQIQNKIKTKTKQNLFLVNSYLLLA